MKTKFGFGDCKSICQESVYVLFSPVTIFYFLLSLSSVTRIDTVNMRIFYLLVLYPTCSSRKSPLFLKCSKDLAASHKMRTHESVVDILQNQSSFELIVSSEFIILLRNGFENVLPRMYVNNVLEH